MLLSLRRLREALAGMGDEYPGRQLLQIKYQDTLGAAAAGAGTVQ